MHPAACCGTFKLTELQKVSACSEIGRLATPLPFTPPMPRQIAKFAYSSTDDDDDEHGYTSEEIQGRFGRSPKAVWSPNAKAYERVWITNP